MLVMTTRSPSIPGTRVCARAQTYRHGEESEREGDYYLALSAGLPRFRMMYRSRTARARGKKERQRERESEREG